MISKERKKNLIERFKEHPEDTGSASVQIALLSERITYLTDHLKNNKRDFHSRRGLLMLVGRRRRLLNYVKENDSKSYSKLLKDLELKSSK